MYFTESTLIGYNFLTLFRINKIYKFLFWYVTIGNMSYHQNSRTKYIFKVHILENIW